MEVWNEHIKSSSKDTSDLRLHQSNWNFLWCCFYTDCVDCADEVSIAIRVSARLINLRGPFRSRRQDALPNDVFKAHCPMC